jgi:putative hydrolase of the HAD superfamily
MDDTLYDQKDPFKKAYDELFGDRFDIDIYELFEARSVRGDEVFELAQQGKMPMDEMHIYRIQKAFEDLGYEVTAEESLAYQRLYEKRQKEIAMSDTVKEMLELCSRSGVTMGMITNGPSDHQWRKIHTLQAERWIPEEYMIISGDVGVIKPYIEIFRIAEKRIGLQPEECLFVGDSYQNDIAPAKKAGWKALWLNRRGQDISGEAYQPDYTVTSETELKDCIERILRAL